MPIDIDQPGSDGWWLNRLWIKLRDRYERLADLDARYRGKGPLPEGSSSSDFYQAFQAKARTNFARLIVEALRHRMNVEGFRTAATQDTDEVGDQVALELWNRCGLPVESAEIHRTAFIFGNAYAIIGRNKNGKAVVTSEDPRQVVTIHDPTEQRVIRAAAKFFYDSEADQQVAYLYRPGRVRTAISDKRLWRDGRIRFTPKDWEWDREQKLPSNEQIPVIRFRNLDGVGEFEPHIDLLDRIDHQTLQRMVIATLQAFRQRVVKNAPTHDARGNKLDWDEILVADPGGVWIIPSQGPDGQPIDLWESSQIDLTPILQANKDDIHHLAAVTSTPLHIFMPDVVNGSAEGASVLREEAGFKVEDRLRRFTPGWQDVMAQSFLMENQSNRADPNKIEIIWAPVDRKSDAEMADAAVKKASIGVPFRQLLLDLGYSPRKVDQLMSDRAMDQLMAALSQPLQAAPAETAPAQEAQGAQSQSSEPPG